MANWIFRRNTRTKLLGCYSEEDLKRFVRMGTASGAEMIKLDQRDAEWVPLWTLPWFREALGVGPEVDLEPLIKKRVGRPMRIFATIFGSYIGICFTAGFLGAMQPGQRAPALAAMAVTAGAIGTIAWLRKRMRAKDAPKKKEMIIAHDELSDALHALEGDLDQCSENVRTRADIGSIKKAILELRTQKSVLASLGGGPSREALQKELADARARAMKAESADSSLRDALADEVRALEGRIQAFDRAASAVVENSARLRAMLHEIHALRLALGRTRIDVSQEDATIERLAELKRELEVEARISDSLDRDAQDESGARAQQARQTQRAMGP